MGRPDFRQQPAGVKVSKTASNFSRLPASPGATQGMNRGEPRWDTPADCRHCALRQQAIFAALRGPDFDHISPSIRASLVPAGTEIYREDTAADAVYMPENIPVFEAQESGCRRQTRGREKHQGSI